MSEDDYLKLFQNIQNENVQNNNFQKLNETPDYSNYQKINEVQNCDNFNIELDTYVNGVKQQRPNTYYEQPKRNRNKGGLNGLDQYIDDDIDEVYRPIKQQQIIQQPVQPQILQPEIINEKFSEVEIVNLDLFEKIGNNALLGLINNKIKPLDASKITNNVDDRKVTFLNS